MPNKIKDNNYTNSLLEEIISPNISFNNISDLITNKIGVNCYVTMYYAFLSNNENRELIIYYYFLNALKFKDKTNNRAGSPALNSFFEEENNETEN